MFLIKWLLNIKKAKSKILRKSNYRNCPDHVSSIFQSYLEQQNYKYSNSCFSTGIKDLDDRLHGLNGGEVILLASRPSMGKTSFAINLSYKIAQSFLKENNQCVLYFCSGGASLTLRQLQCVMTEKVMDVEKFYLHISKNQSMSYKELKTVADINNKLEKLPFYICDSYELSLDYIASKIKEISCYTQIGFIVVDYLMLFSFKNYSAYTTLQGLKKIAQKLNVPILVLGQLSRNIEKRSDKRPLISDDDIGIMAAPFCDKILFLYRESYYLEMFEPQKKQNETQEHFDKRVQCWENKYQKSKNECDIIIARNKYARSGLVKCFCNLEYGIWDDLKLSKGDVPF